MERNPTTFDDAPPARFEAESGDSDSPRVCYCMKVHEATIRRAIRRGADVLETLKAGTRAGTGCGTCRPDLIELLEQETERRPGGE